ncbi:MAG: hybrid sensor histidine kinase/response regulator, partial [Desulfuromonas sp.]
RYKNVTKDRKIVFVNVSSIDINNKLNLVIEVYDKGVGMSAEVIKNATEEFYTTKTAREGTGLGLSIVNDIIKKHDGSLNIESIEGEYTKVRVILPTEFGGD